MWHHVRLISKWIHISNEYEYWLIVWSQSGCFLCESDQYHVPKQIILTQIPFSLPNWADTQNISDYFMAHSNSILCMIKCKKVRVSELSTFHLRSGETADQIMI